MDLTENPSGVGVFFSKWLQLTGNGNKVLLDLIWSIP
jgi:hypothetical protein